MGYLCKKFKWESESNLNYFYQRVTDYNSLTPIEKLEVFTSSHPDIRKKRIIKDLTVTLDDYLVENKHHKFVFYNLVKINHDDFDKSDVSKVKILFPSITTIDDKIESKSIVINNLNWKLNANEDILILPSYLIDDTNTEGLY